jgi:hypothetical protein
MDQARLRLSGGLKSGNTHQALEAIFAFKKGLTTHESSLFYYWQTFQEVNTEDISTDWFDRTPHRIQHHIVSNIAAPEKQNPTLREDV